MKHQIRIILTAYPLSIAIFKFAGCVFACSNRAAQNENEMSAYSTGKCRWLTNRSHLCFLLFKNPSNEGPPVSATRNSFPTAVKHTAAAWGLRPLLQAVGATDALRFSKSSHLHFDQMQ